ncbi:MAG: phosphatase PAP2 family protein [Bdellovibrionia bacterium]
MRQYLRLSVCVSVVFTICPGRLIAAASPDSVYEISPAVDAAIIGATALGSVIPQTLSSHLISPSCPCNAGDVNGFDRPTIGNHSQTAATISDVTLGAAMLVPPVLDYLTVGAGSAWVEDLVVYSEVLSVSGAFTTLSKFTVQRPIPLEYSGDLSHQDTNGYASFFSGHTALAFAALSAAAITADYRYHLGAWPWLVVAGAGASVAYERVAAGRHFPTDVMMGALAGTVTGVFIPIFHRRKSDPLPVTISWEDQGVMVTWRYHF